MDQPSPPGGPFDFARRPLFVVGVDGSDSGRAALCEAAREAARADARLLCVHVRPPLGFAEFAALLAPGAVMISRDCRDLMEMQAWLDCVRILDPLCRSWEFEAVSGRPDLRLREVTVARHADALFVGQSHRSNWSRWFHRCPARRLARSHECPVRLATTS